MKCYCSGGAESTGQREGRISGSCSDGAPKTKDINWECSSGGASLLAK